MCSKIDHRLYREAHPSFRSANCFVLAIVRDVGSAVEQLIYPMANICLHHAAISAVCVFFDGVAKVTEETAWFNQRDGPIKALSCCLHNTHGFGIGSGLVSDIVRLVDIAVEATVVKGDINVYNIPIHERSFVRNTVANDLID